MAHLVISRCARGLLLKEGKSNLIPKIVVTICLGVLLTGTDAKAYVLSPNPQIRPRRNP